MWFMRSDVLKDEENYQKHLYEYKWLIKKEREEYGKLLYNISKHKRKHMHVWNFGQTWGGNMLRVMVT